MAHRWVRTLLPLFVLVAGCDAPVPEPVRPPDTDPRNFGPSPIRLAERADTLTSDTLLSFPTSIEVLPDGKLLIHDFLAPAVLLFSERGQLLQSYDKRGQGPGELVVPQGIAAFPDGSVWVLDSGRSRMIEFRLRSDSLLYVGGFNLTEIHDVPLFFGMCGLGDRVLLAKFGFEPPFLVVGRDRRISLSAGSPSSEGDMLGFFQVKDAVVRCFPQRNEFGIVFADRPLAQVFDVETGEVTETLDLIGYNHIVREDLGTGIGGSRARNGRPTELPMELFWHDELGYVAQVQERRLEHGLVEHPRVLSAWRSGEGMAWTDQLPRISQIIGDTILALEADLTPRLIRRFRIDES